MFENDGGSCNGSGGGDSHHCRRPLHSTTQTNSFFLSSEYPFFLHKRKTDKNKPFLKEKERKAQKEE